MHLFFVNINHTINQQSKFKKKQQIIIKMNNSPEGGGRRQPTGQQMEEKPPVEGGGTRGVRGGRQVGDSRGRAREGEGYREEGGWRRWLAASAGQQRWRGWGAQGREEEIRREREREQKKKLPFFLISPNLATDSLSIAKRVANQRRTAFPSLIPTKLATDTLIPR